MRTVRRLRLRLVFLRPGSPNPNGFHIAELSVFLLVAPSKLIQAHQKHSNLDSNLVLVLSICASHSADQNVYGGPGRYCPAVRDTFQLTSYNYKIKQSF